MDDQDQEQGELPREVAERLTEAQRDGRACRRCGGEEGPMVPRGTVAGVQTFAHQFAIDCNVEAIVNEPESHGARRGL